MTNKDLNVKGLGQDNHETIKQFVYTLAEYKDEKVFINVWTLSDKKSHRFQDLTQAVSYIERHKTQNIFFQVGVTKKNLGLGNKGTQNQMDGLLGLYCDIDVAHAVHAAPNLPTSIEEAVGLVKGHGFDPSIIINSGHGIQAWWVFEEPWMFDSDEERQQAINLSTRMIETIRARNPKYKIDGVMNIERVLRIPGTWNCKESKNKILATIIEINDGRYDPGDFDNVLIQIEPITFHNTTTSKQRTTDEILMAGVQKEKQASKSPVTQSAKTKQKVPSKTVLDLQMRSGNLQTPDIIEVLCYNLIEFNMLWNEKIIVADSNPGKALDTSPSGLDDKVAYWLALTRQPDQVIADAIYCFRVKHINDIAKTDREDYMAKAKREDYIAHTIRHARKKTQNSPELVPEPETEPLPVSTHSFQVPTIDDLRKAIMLKNKHGRFYQGFITPDMVLEACYELSVGDAFLFEKQFVNQYCYDHAAGDWHQWAGHHWQLDKKNKHRDDAKKLYKIYQNEAHEYRKEAKNEQNSAKQKDLNDKADVLSTGAKRLMRPPGTKAVLYYAEPSLGITGEEWDKHPYILPVANGIIDLKTGKLLPGEQDLYMKTYTPVSYDPNRPYPKYFIQAINTYFPDKKMQEYIQRVFGMALIGEQIEHKLFIFHGPGGRNGKDSLLESVSSCLGPLAGTVSPEALLSQTYSRDASAPSPHLMALKGKRLAWCAEINKKRDFDTAVVKSLTGGNPIIARPPYGKRNVEFDPSHTLFMAVNDLPSVSDNDPAFWKRVHKIDFTAQFVDNPVLKNEYQVDQDFKRKMMSDPEGILKWLVAGCLEYLRIGLKPPARVLNAVSSYKQTQDTFTRFQAECIEPCIGVKLRAGIAFDNYESWCQKNKLSPINNTDFGICMKANYTDPDDSKKPRDGAGNFYPDIRLKQLAPVSQEPDQMPSLDEKAF